MSVASPTSAILREQEGRNWVKIGQFKIFILAFKALENRSLGYLSSRAIIGQGKRANERLWSPLPWFTKHPKGSVNNKEFKWQARSRVNDKGQLASMQPVSVKDRSRGVTIHMGSGPIYGATTHNPLEPDESCCCVFAPALFCSFCFSCHSLGGCCSLMLSLPR